jgi:DNA-binding transcriptional LysR family regulator
MDLNALQLFVVAAEAGSISEAARRCGVPLPTLSRRIRKLEDALGQRLLERGPKGLALTSAGNQLLADAQPALAALLQAKQRLHDASGVAGRLRISMPPHLESLWPIFRSFGQSYPSVTFDIFVTDRRVDLVADGIDIALRVGERGSAGYVGRVLARYRHRVIASPSFVAAHRLTEPRDLSRVPCGCWRASGPPTWRLGGDDLSLEPTFVTNDYQHLLRLAEAGDLVTEVPPFLAASGMAAGRLVEPFPNHPLPEYSMRALVVERRSMSPLVRHFLDHATKHVAAALGIST